MRWNLNAPLYGDEAIHYYVAKHLWAHPTNVFPEFTYSSALFYQRPMFSILLHPGTWFGVEGYRVWHILLGATSVPLAWFLVRPKGLLWATLAALGLTVQPIMVLWGVITFPDALMTSLILGAWLLYEREKHLAAGLVLLLAIWVKEVAIVFAVLLAVQALIRSRKEGGTLYPLVLNRSATAWIGVLAFATLPMQFANVFVGGQPTGWSTSGLSVPFWIVLSGGTLVLAILLTGVGQKQRAAYMGLAFPAFYALYGWVLGRGVDSWYAYAPVAIAWVASVIIAADSKGSIRRLAVVGLGLTLVHSLIALPLVTPGFEDQTTQEIYHEWGSEDHFRNALAQIPSNATVLTADIQWFHQGMVADSFHFAGFGRTDAGTPAATWEFAINASDYMFLYPTGGRGNLALQAAYEPCLFYQNSEFKLYHAPCEAADPLHQDDFELN